MYSEVVYNDHEALNSIWVIISTCMIFFMQTGFSLIENGSVRSKNSSAILIKNMFDSCYGALAFWAFGFSWAKGNDSLFYFISFEKDYFFGHSFETYEEDLYLSFVFQFSFAATSATIVSGALSERVNMTAYVGFSIFMTGFIYPVVANWIWNEGGRSFPPFGCRRGRPKTWV